MKDYCRKDTLKAVVVFVAIAIFGNLLHFLYSRCPNAFFAVISPVNESVWEHIKLIFLPLVISAVIMGRKDRARLALGLLFAPITCVLMIITSGLYHITFGQNDFVVDIIAYYADMAIGFWVPQCLKVKNLRPFVLWIAIALDVVLAILIAVFSFFPPNHMIFADLS